MGVAFRNIMYCVGMFGGPVIIVYTSDNSIYQFLKIDQCPFVVYMAL